MIFLIIHAETWAINKQFNKSFTNMWCSIPDIYCLFETLNENTHQEMSDLHGQLAKGKLSTVVVIHKNSFECCFSLWTKTKRSVSVHLKVERKSKCCFEWRKKCHDYFLLLGNHWETPPSLVPSITAVCKSFCKKWMNAVGWWGRYRAL